jgi:WD40 repeat protein
VTVCKFNHSGSKLATGSKDQTVIIWNVSQSGHISFDKTLSIGVPCCYLSWSPDDSHILAVGNEDSSDVWLFDVKNGTEVMNSNLLKGQIVQDVPLPTCKTQFAKIVIFS